MSKHYDEARVIRSLTKKGIKISTVDNTVTVPYSTTNLGNGSWGKIDFLCKHCGYIFLRTGKVPEVISAIVDNRYIEDDSSNTKIKRRKKSNLN